VRIAVTVTVELTVVVEHAGTVVVNMAYWVTTHAPELPLPPAVGVGDVLARAETALVENTPAAPPTTPPPFDADPELPPIAPTPPLALLAGEAAKPGEGSVKGGLAPASEAILVAGAPGAKVGRVLAVELMVAVIGSVGARLVLGEPEIKVERAVAVEGLIDCVEETRLVFGLLGMKVGRTAVVEGVTDVDVTGVHPQPPLLHICWEPAGHYNGGNKRN
jgi:hypothetical protein